MTLPSPINLVTLGVEDVAASTVSYERLGWTKSKASNEQVTFFHSNGAVLGLFGRQSLADDAHVIDAKHGFGGITLAQNFDSSASNIIIRPHLVVGLNRRHTEATTQKQTREYPRSRAEVRDRISSAHLRVIDEEVDDFFRVSRS